MPSLVCCFVFLSVSVFSQGFFSTRLLSPVVTHFCPKCFWGIKLHGQFWGQVVKRTGFRIKRMQVLLHSSFYGGSMPICFRNE